MKKINIFVSCIFWYVSAKICFRENDIYVPEKYKTTISRGKKSGNFGIFGHGKPGKVREFHLPKVLTTLSMLLTCFDSTLLQARQALTSLNLLMDSLVGLLKVSILTPIDCCRT